MYMYELVLFSSVCVANNDLHVFNKSSTN